MATVDKMNKLLEVCALPTLTHVVEILHGPITTEEFEKIIQDLLTKTHKYLHKFKVKFDKLLRQR